MTKRKDSEGEMTLQAQAEALYAGIRSLLGQHDANQVQAKLERELRHVVPTWNQTTPDCPGWYWFKPQGVSEPRLLLVSHGRIDTKLMADLGACLTWGIESEKAAERGQILTISPAHSWTMVQKIG
jgi:hypothetical protein